MVPLCIRKEAGYSLSHSTCKSHSGIPQLSHPTITVSLLLSCVGNHCSQWLLLSIKIFKLPLPSSVMMIHQPLSMGTTDINPYHSALISVYLLTLSVLGACLLIFTCCCPPLNKILQPLCYRIIKKLLLEGMQQ